MENTKERVLAYRSSKVIDQKELSTVSGGVHWSQHETLGCTGGSGAGADACVDMSVDW